jgi:hypothetical protein
MSRGRLAKYALWQFRDFVMDKGISIVIIGVLIGFVQLLPFRLPGSPELTPGLVTRLVITMAKTVLLLSVFIAVNGMVSTDRKLGYYRFLFAKPVRPFQYYAQLWVIYLIGLLAATILLSALFFWYAGPFSILNLTLYATLLYVALGGIGFFVSSITKHEMPALAAIWLGASVLRAMYGDDSGWKNRALDVLPPVHTLDGVATSLISGGTADITHVLWLAGYGALFFVLGLIVLHRRPLAA